MNVLIVYFSRTGVTEKVARRVAELLTETSGTSVKVEGLVDRKHRKGVMGWLRSGKDAARKHETEIAPLESDPSTAEVLIVGTPVWAWTCSPAVRTFLHQYADSLPQRLALFCTMGGSGDEGAFHAMQETAGREPLATLSLIDRHVKADHPDRYQKPVDEFVDQIRASH